MSRSDLQNIEDVLDGMPTMNCPKCGKEWPDFDGFGVLYCPKDNGGCGYCKHASVMDGICQFCEKPVERRGSNRETVTPNG